MCGRWLQDAAGDPYPSAHRQLPARLREYLVGALEVTAAHITAENGDGGTDTDDDPVARDEVAIAVVDYICSLRDAQAAILTSQLHQSPDPAQMHVSWLNA